MILRLVALNISNGHVRLHFTVWWMTTNDNIKKNYIQPQPAERTCCQLKVVRYFRQYWESLKSVNEWLEWPWEVLRITCEGSSDKEVLLVVTLASPIAWARHVDVRWWIPKCRAPSVKKKHRIGGCLEWNFRLKKIFRLILSH